MPLNILHQLKYSPILVHLVVIRRCNLSCRYCSEHDLVSEPVPTDVLEQRLEKLRELGTFGIGFSGGEPTLHPDLPRLVRRCRELGFLRTGMISNGFLLSPELIDRLNDAGLQELQLSIDGVSANATTQKVLNNLKKRLNWLSERARFAVTVNAVIGACPPEDVSEVVDSIGKLGFRPRVQFVHDSQGQLKLSRAEIQAFEQIVRQVPRDGWDRSNYRLQMLREGSAPFRCRAGSRYLYIDEHGKAGWCSQTRNLWSKPLVDYGPQDLMEQFFSYKPCHATCTVGCVRAASEIDRWRRQEQPARVPVST